MKNLLYFSLLLALTSCMTVGRIQRNCDEFVKVCGTETQVWTEYRDTTIYRTDTIRVKLPSDTVRITDTLRIVNNLAYLPVTHKRFGLIGVDAGVNRSVLSVNAYLTDSTILHTRADAILIEKPIWEEKETNLVPVKYVPGFYRFTLWLFIAQALVIVFWILVSTRRLDIKGMLKPVLSVFQRERTKFEMFHWSLFLLV